MYYGLSLILTGLALRYFLIRDKLRRTHSANMRQYDSFEAYRNNILLRAAVRLLGLLSVLMGMLLIGFSLVRRSF
ncbi:hypothetical protein [Fibrella forsythiae]|uniref:Molybdenum ABC transporter permease n=1 Tax=Fibrella forsythiae TaxID=2817061 RepID=A0ABS3JT67_9BACT|nr:hypothetical protein [Fibrella forsythiae]MBO0953208.1 hypothetical protein [Fibrella forsythiae]